MDEEKELLDSENETVDQETEETLENDSESDIDLDAEADVEALKEKNRQLFARAKKAEAELKKTKIQQKPKAEPTKSDDIEKTVESVLAKRELDDLDISDELKKEVQTYAKLAGVSVKKALSSDYIQFKKEKEEKNERVKEASLGTKSRPTGAKREYDIENPPQFDLSTEQGKKEFADYEEYLKKKLG